MKQTSGDSLSTLQPRRRESPDLAERVNTALDRLRPADINKSRRSHGPRCFSACSHYCCRGLAPVPQQRRVAVAPLQMANNPGAIKRIKQSERNRVANAAWRSRVRTWTRKTKEAVDAGDVDAAPSAPPRGDLRPSTARRAAASTTKTGPRATSRASARRSSASSSVRSCEALKAEPVGA